MWFKRATGRESVKTNFEIAEATQKGVLRRSVVVFPEVRYGSAFVSNMRNSLQQKNVYEFECKTARGCLSGLEKLRSCNNFVFSRYGEVETSQAAIHNLLPGLPPLYDRK